MVDDIKTPFEKKGLELLREIEQFGDVKFTLDLLKLLLDHYEEDFEAAILENPKEPENEA